MVLSKRLTALAGLVEDNTKCLADVGCDHGFLPIYLVESGKVERAIAMDVNRGPLERAEEHVKAEQLEEKIELRLSDGMRELKPGEADTVVIAGMGGPLMIRLLEEGKNIAEDAGTLVLSPHSEVADVRSWLSDNGFVIEAEDMVCEDGKYYMMFRASFAGEAPEGCSREEKRLQETYGPVLLAQKHPVLKDYLQYEKKKWSGILEGMRRADVTPALEKSIEEIEEKLRWNSLATRRILQDEMQ